MDTGRGRLNDFIASAGAGFDAAGRPVYSAPTAMYMGPSEFSSMQNKHAELKRQAQMEESEKDRQIRMLLDRLAQYDQPGYKWDYRMISALPQNQFARGGGGGGSGE